MADEAKPTQCVMSGPPPKRVDGGGGDGEEGDEALPVMLTREVILGVSDLAVAMVDVPEWGGAAFVRTLSGRERDAFEATLSDGKRKNLRDFRARFAVRVLCDDKGKPLFTDADIPTLTQKNAKALDRIFEAGRHFNGMTDQDVEELEKNSESAPSADCGSA